MKIVEWSAQAHGQSAKSGFWNHDDGCPDNQGCGAELTLQTVAGTFDRCVDAATHAAHGDAKLTSPEPCRCVNRDFDMKVALIHSEFSEALEEYRLGEKKHGGPFGVLLYDCADLRLTDDQYHNFSDGCPLGVNNPLARRPHKPVGFMSELADVAIRCFDLIGQLGCAEGVARIWARSGGPHASRRPYASPQGEITFGRTLLFAHLYTAKLGTALHNNSRAVPDSNEHCNVQGALFITLGNCVKLAEHVGADAAALDSAIEIKMAYNATRAKMHGKAF